MAPIPRIMVVDPTERLGDIVRAALAMLNRRHIMVEIPTADAALDEVFRSEIDLAVTAYMLDESMNGIEWAERAIREQAGAPIIVAASPDDPRPDPTRLKNAPFQHIIYTSGEPFLRAVRIGLDGEEVVAAEEGMGQAQLDLGPIPKLDVDAARAILIGTIRDLGAIGGLISDRAGRIVVDEGATSYVDKTLLTTMLGPSFAQSVKIARQVGGNGWTLKYYEGKRYSLFALALGYHYFALFLVDADDKFAFGNITRSGRRDINKIMELLGEAAWIYETTPEAVVETETAVAEPEAEVSAAAPAPVAEAPPVAEPEDLAAKLFATPLDPIDNLDVDALFDQQADEDAFEDVFADDVIETGTDLLDDDDSVSYEEAQNMGLLGD